MNLRLSASQKVQMRRARVMPLRDVLDELGARAVAVMTFAASAQHARTCARYATAFSA